MTRFDLVCRRAVFAVVLVCGLVIPAGAGTTDQAGLDRVLASVMDEIGLADARIIRVELEHARADEKMRVGVVLDGVEVTLELWSHSVRGESMRVREEIGKDIWRVLDAGPVRTVRGRVLEIEDARVAGSVSERGLMAGIEAPEFGEYWIEPVAQGLRAGDDTLHVVYRAEDVIGKGGICGVVDGMEVEHGGHEGHTHASRGGPCGSQVCVTEIAIDTDVEFLVALGNTTAAQLRIEDIMNLVTWQYESQVGITYEIVEIMLRTSEEDPYSSTDAGTLLNQFRSHWNASQGGIQRDVAHLFTGKEIDSDTIGIAWVGVICTGSAYGLSQTPYNGSFSCKASLVAHELGHNWSAPHCECPGNTMNPSNTCFRIFTSGTQAIIENHRDSRGCLHGGTVPPPDSFTLLVPTDGRVNVGTSPTLQWQGPVRAISYRLLVDDDADFSSPEIDLNTPDRVVSISGLHPARLYYWKVSATGIGGTVDGDETFCFFTASTIGRELYVDRDAPAGGTGLSWGSALDSLAYAQEIGRCIAPQYLYEIHVAEGTYELGESLDLASGLELLGGYPGYNAPDPEARDRVAHETVLSGGAGVARGAGLDHVVISNDDDAATLIDGFTIELGDAQDGLGGGGILMNNSSAVVSNCVIRACSSGDPGGAVRVNGGSAAIVNCLIQACGATNGAAVYTDAPMTMTNCTVIGNNSVGGGAVALDGAGSVGSVDIVNTVFHANSSGSIDTPGGSLTADVTYSYVPEGIAGTGNRSLPASPNFVDKVGGDLTPGVGSALIDAGDSGAAGLSGITEDLGGNARDIDAANYADGGGGTVDIGAYEAAADTPAGAACDGDANGDNVIDVNDISYVLFRLGDPCACVRPPHMPG